MGDPNVANSGVSMCWVILLIFWKRLSLVVLL